jgi:hypothetical protein
MQVLPDINPTMRIKISTPILAFWSQNSPEDEGGCGTGPAGGSQATRKLTERGAMAQSNCCITTSLNVEPFERYSLRLV